MSGSWKEKLENPVVIAATVGSLITLAVSVVGGISGTVSAYFQGRSQVLQQVIAVSFGSDTHSTK
jgi:hypothetical protein